MKRGCQQHPSRPVRGSEEQPPCPALPAEAPQLQLSPRRWMRSSVQPVSQRLAPQGLEAAGISDPPWQRGGCGRGRALTCRADREGRLREAKPCFEEETWVCFGLQGNQTGFSIQAARSPLPASSPLHSSHSPALCCGGDSREQPPALAHRFSSFPGQTSPELPRDRLAPQEGGAGTPLLLPHRQAPASGRAASSSGTQGASGAGTVISAQRSSPCN